MTNYTYENVKEAYKAIIEIGKATAKGGLIGGFTANIQHNKNLNKLEGASKELYQKLLDDEDINY